MSRLYYFIICAVFWGSFSSKTTHALSEVSIHQVCRSQYLACLEQLPGYLVSTNVKSRVWFTYKRYQYEALFALARYQELRQELEQVLHRQDLPLMFKIHSTVLFGKIIKYEGQVELADKYFNDAKETLLAVNKEWPNPLELVQIGNLLNSLQQYQLGYEMLLNVEKQFSHYQEPNFRYQLYTNLGHLAYRIDKHQQHISYRLQAVSWSKDLINPYDHALALFNAGRAYFFVKQDKEAIDYFRQAIPVAERARNKNLLGYSYINLADIYLRQQQYLQVAEVLDKVDVKQLEVDYQQRYQAIMQQLDEKKPSKSPGKK